MDTFDEARSRPKTFDLSCLPPSLRAIAGSFRRPLLAENKAPHTIEAYLHAVR